MPQWDVPASFITELSRHTMSWRHCLGCQSNKNNSASSYKSDRVCRPRSNALIQQLSYCTWVRLSTSDLTSYCAGCFMLLAFVPEAGGRGILHIQPHSTATYACRAHPGLRQLASPGSDGRLRGDPGRDRKALGLGTDAQCVQGRYFSSFGLALQVHSMHSHNGPSQELWSRLSMTESCRQPVSPPYHCA